MFHSRPSTSTADPPPLLRRLRSADSSGSDAADREGVDRDYPPPAQPSGSRAVNTPTKEKEGKAKKKNQSNKPPVTSSSSTTSNAESTSDEEATLAARRRRARRAVTQLIDAAAPTKSANRGKKNFTPCNFIKRGTKFQKVGHGEALLPEYFLALKSMAKAPECPPGWAPHLAKHEEHVLTLARTWDWPTCRHWSETVFALIHDGTLPEGWNDVAALKELQRDITTVGKRLAYVRDAPATKTEVARKVSYTAPATQARAEPLQRQTSADPNRVLYDKEKDGKPCYPWNWGRECGFNTSHGPENDLKPHICAYCAYRTHKVLGHREMECINKQRSAQRAQANVNTQKDF